MSSHELGFPTTPALRRVEREVSRLKEERLQFLGRADGRVGRLSPPMLQRAQILQGQRLRL